MRYRLPIALCTVLLVTVYVVSCKKDSTSTSKTADEDTATEPVAAEPDVDEPTDTATAAEAADAAAASAAAEASVANAETDKSSFIAPLPASFDPKTFAGGYGADGSTSLAVTADGHFSLSVDDKTIEGRWKQRPDGATIVLDPSDIDEPDRLLEVLPDGTVKLIGGPTLPRAANDR